MIRIMQRRILPLFGALLLVLCANNLAFAAGTSYAAIGMGLSVLGIGIGLGLIGFAAMGGIARQPEQAGTIQSAMIVIGGLVEGAGILSLILCLVTIFVDK
jgi:F-type H+-transporting ATPase subunit c